MAARHPSPPFCSAADQVWILHLTCWTRLCIWNDPPPSNPPPPFSRHGERVVTLFRCYHAPLSWSLVTENVVNPPHQWEGADWLTPRFQKGSRDWGDEHGRWPSPQTNPEPNERKRDKNPKARMCEIWTTGFFFFLKKRTAMSTCTTRAHFISEYRKGNNINIHDPVPPFQIQHPPCVLLHPNPPSSSLPLPSIGWQHLVGHMVRQLLQGNMGICGATQRKGGDNTGDVGVFVRGCRWHWGRVIAIFMSCIFFFFFFFCNSFFSVSDH